MTISEDIEKGTEKARKFWAALRQYLGLIVVVSGSVAGVLKWYHETYPPTEPVTTVQMDDRFNELHELLAAFNYRDSLYKDSLRVERAQYDSLGRIVILALSDVQVRVGRLESGQVETRLAVEESKRAGKQSTVEVIAQINRMGSAEERAKAKREQEEKEWKSNVEAILEGLAKKGKVSHKPFDTR